MDPKKRLQKARKEDYPIIKCPRCKREGYIVESEGISSIDGAHYPIGSCVYCSKNEKSIINRCR